VYGVGMELFIVVAMVCVFIAGRKSVKNRLHKLENNTDYLIDATYDPATSVLTVNKVYRNE
jgi:hypothetical protein